MRILFLSSQLPEPAHGGGALRVNGLVRGIHAAGHTLHLLAFGTPDQHAAARPWLDRTCARAEVVPPPQRSLRQRLHDLLLTGLADMQRRAYSPLFVERLAHLLAEEPYDLVHLEGLEMMIYLPVIRQIQPNTPAIYGSQNAEAALQRTIFEAERGSLRRLPGTIYSGVQARRLARFERASCEGVAHVISVSDADAEAHRQLAPGTPVSVVPNGIDVQTYEQADSTLDLGPAALVFTGSMNYRPNVDAALWFAENVLGRVRQQIPDAKFFVVGSQPHRRLDTLRERGDVEITGWVPDVNPFLHAAAVYVVPLRMGSGTRLKLLQAMAARRAIVSTTIGAQGLHAHDGVEMVLADSAADFARAVLDLLAHPERRAALGEAASVYVQAHYDWSAIVPCLLDVYEQVVSERAPR
ncbi:MAG: glycosyltransferase [Chloroflexi bacterium]|nr:glycosyltransferase [Chloroflexota bacterium]